MEEKEYNVITLENGIEYTEIFRLDNEGNTYIVLSNLDNPEDFCIRKLIIKDGEDYIVGLENEEEFNKVFKIFGEKFMN